MSNSSSNSIMTNPISEMLNKNSLASENDYSTDDSSSMSWLSIILGIIIIGFIVFISYKYYTGGENIYEKIYLKIKDLIESVKYRFQSTAASIKSEPTKIEKHMKEDHEVEQKTPQKNEDEYQLTQALNQATPNYAPPDSGYSADDSYSSIQKSKSSSKSGWCYIGEDRGFRSCINVGENDTCMSGDIFPTSDICVNPKLRM